MIIHDARLWRFNTPLVRPVEVRPGITIDDREILLLELVAADGQTGWGEAAPLPGFSRESLDDVIAGARLLVAEIRSWRPNPPGVLDLPGISGQVAAELPSLQFAAETAVESLVRRGVGRGATVRMAGLLQGDSQELATRAAALVRAGYTCLKVKVGRVAVDEDVSRLRLVRDRVGGAVELRVDANQSWTWDDAVRFAGGTSDLDIEFVEEPLRDAVALPRLREETGMRIALDESLREWTAELETGIPDFAAALVLKPTLLGGHLTRRLARAARGAGISAVMSSCYESGVGTAAVARAALLCGSDPPAVGAGTLAWLVDDGLQSPVDFMRPALTADEISFHRVRPAVSRLQPVPIE